MKVNELLKHYRLMANKTQKEWAGTAISPSFYSKIEKGLNRITADDLVSLLDYNNISAAEFFENINLEKSLQYDREYELKKLIGEAYYKSSLDKLKHVKAMIEQETLPNKKDLLVLVKGYIALVNNNVAELD
ncbi:XRE family transcriptional regulator, partial [Lactobacillus sp. XV13L]|nr:XRE family transcriptional regulator [Lactobacillus sp. XV13L]